MIVTSTCLVNGSPKKRGRKKKEVSDDESIGSFSSGSEVEFMGAATPVLKERTTSRRVAAKPLRYNFSDDENGDSSDGELELFENDGINENNMGKQEKLDTSSESETEKPMNKTATSEDMFDSLVGM